jgi:hypothetical protein
MGTSWHASAPIPLSSALSHASANKSEHEHTIPDGRKRQGYANKAVEGRDSVFWEYLGLRQIKKTAVRRQALGLKLGHLVSNIERRCPLKIGQSIPLCHRTFKSEDIFFQFAIFAQEAP